MSWTATTLNEPTNPASVFMDALDALIVPHAAWEFVEEINDGGTGVARIYKCLGTVNTHGRDFFVIVRRTAANANYVYWTIAETYTSLGATIGNFAPGVSNVSGTGCFNTPAADGSTPLADQPVFTLTHVQWIYTTLAATPINYYVSVSNDRITVATGAGPGVSSSVDGVYVGAFERFPGNLENNPLIVCALPLASRNATQTTAAEPAWGSFTHQTISVAAARQNFLASANTAAFISSPSGVGWNDYPESSTRRWHLSKVMLGSPHTTNTGDGSITYQIRGFFIGVRAGRSGGSHAHNKGDRYLEDGVYWVHVGRITTGNNSGYWTVDSSL